MCMLGLRTLWGICGDMLLGQALSCVRIRTHFGRTIRRLLGAHEADIGSFARCNGKILHKQCTRFCPWQHVFARLALISFYLRITLAALFPVLQSNGYMFSHA